jgi:hypothetical protein
MHTVHTWCSQLDTLYHCSTLVNPPACSLLQAECTSFDVELPSIRCEIPSVVEKRKEEHVRNGRTGMEQVGCRRRSIPAFALVRRAHASNG